MKHWLKHERVTAKKKYLPSSDMCLKDELCNIKTPAFHELCHFTP